MHSHSRGAGHQLLLLLALVGAPKVLCQTAKIIRGELDVLIPEGHPPLFIVRNGKNIKPILVAKDAVYKLIPYSGYRVQIRVATPTPSPPPPHSPRKRPARQGRSLLQLTLQNTINGTTSTDPTSALPDAEFTQVDSVEVIGPAGSEVEKNAVIGPQNITSVVYLLRFCGFGAAIKSAAFRSMWLNSNNTPSSGYTMQNYWSNCSNGLANMVAANQVIVEIPLPCNGTYGRWNYSFGSRCGEAELYSWMFMAEDYTRDVLKINTNNIKQRIVVLPAPKNSICPWAGLASVGCVGTRCFTWINGVVAKDLTVYMHEMGHNFGLMHSGRVNYSWEYADQTCTMGSGYGCYNVANLWRMGWAIPVSGGDLNSTNMAIGTWRQFRLPYATQNLNNHVRIFPDWAPSASLIYTNSRVSRFPGFYISLRNWETFDKGHPNMIPKPGRVLIHTSNATQVLESYQGPMLMDVLDVGATFRTQLPFGIVVRVDSITSALGATISVCRATVDYESDKPGLCNDGLDNDCDGLPDGTDTDCALSRANAPSPPGGRRNARPPHQKNPPSPSGGRRNARPPYQASPPVPPRRANRPPKSHKRKASPAHLG